MSLSPIMKQAIADASTEFWIDYNYEVAQGRKTGDGVFEWLDEEEEEQEELGLNEQLNLHAKNPEEWDNIFPMEGWPLEDYQNLYKLIGNKMLIPHKEYAGGYVLTTSTTYHISCQ